MSDRHLPLYRDMQSRPISPLRSGQSGQFQWRYIVLFLVIALAVYIVTGHALFIVP